LIDGARRVQALDKAVSSAEQVVLANRRSFQAGIRSTLDILAADQRVAQVNFERAQARIRLLLNWIRLHSLVNETRLDIPVAFDSIASGSDSGISQRPY
jgi:outer membrane protein TolC